MNKIKKLAQTVAALMLSAVFAAGLTACNAADGHKHTDADSDGVCDSCNQPLKPSDGNTGDSGNTGDNGDTADSGNTGGNGNTGDSGNTDDGGNTGGDTGDGGNKDPVIPAVPADAVKIQTAHGDLESSYVTWTEVAGGAKSYNVYVKPDGGEYVKLDTELVRKYSGYYRADAVGLKAGDYTMKVVPVGSDDSEKEGFAGTAQMYVAAHDRSGYAFVDGTSSGAYKEDGTLRDNARVIYITQNTKNTVSLEVTGANANPCVGLQDILNGYKKRKDSRPLCVRIIGNITDLSNMDKGDIVIDGPNVGITVEGIGSDATVNGWGLRVKGASNVEIRNLGFMNCNSEEGDNVGLQQDNDHVWVHNCDMFYGHAGSDKDQVKGDGALDTKTSKYITHSYNHFWDSGKCNLQGMKSEKTENTITYHHNWYDHSDSRHPRIRTCTVHIYNNYFDGNAKYGVGVTMGASAFVENNYFRSKENMKPMLSSGQGTDAKGEGTFSGENGGIIKAYGNKFDGSYSLVTQNDTSDKTDIDCYMATSRGEEVPAEYVTKAGGTKYSNFDTASGFYTYTADDPDTAKAKVEKWAGRVDGGDLKYDFNDDVEDGNYIVIQELKDMLTGYKSSPLEIGGVEVKDIPSGGSTEGGESGGNTGGSSEPVTGSLVYLPSADGYAGKGGIAVVGGQSSSNKSLAVDIGGTSIDAKKALKMDSNATVKFTLSAETEVKIYLYIDSVKIDGVKTKAVAESNYFVYSLKFSAGEHTIEKGDGENALYMIVIS